jgi:hypothetical protein
MTQDYVHSRRVQRVLRRNNDVNRFVTYVWTTYVCPTATFRPPMWSVYDRAMTVRTNNSVEGYHSPCLVSLTMLIDLLGTLNFFL